MKEIVIKPPFIKLEQFLKFINYSETGGNAKFLIQDGQVAVNGDLCTMRGKKLYDGDLVKTPDGEEYKCVITELKAD